ncbi:hypothetical protein LINPERPRIM_LOCUS31237, partial [Linum perenne]
MNWNAVIEAVCKWKNDGVRGKTKMLLWRVMISQVWIERCKRVFGGARQEANSLVQQIRDEIR